jgi:hypothetical protein
MKVFPGRLNWRSATIRTSGGGTGSTAAESLVAAVLLIGLNFSCLIVGTTRKQALGQDLTPGALFCGCYGRALPRIQGAPFLWRPEPPCRCCVRSNASTTLKGGASHESKIDFAGDLRDSPAAAQTVYVGRYETYPAAVSPWPRLRRPRANSCAARGESSRICDGPRASAAGAVPCGGSAIRDSHLENCLAAHTTVASLKEAIATSHRSIATGLSACVRRGARSRRLSWLNEIFSDVTG